MIDNAGTTRRLNLLRRYAPYKNVPFAKARRMLRVMRNPVSTKKTVTPRNPPCSIEGRIWYSTMPMIASALKPSNAASLCRTIFESPEALARSTRSRRAAYWPSTP